jgi:hypothetical protein
VTGGSLAAICCFLLSFPSQFGGVELLLLEALAASTKPAVHDISCFDQSKQMQGRIKEERKIKYHGY